MDFIPLSFPQFRSIMTAGLGNTTHGSKTARPIFIPPVGAPKTSTPFSRPWVSKFKSFIFEVNYDDENLWNPFPRKSNHKMLKKHLQVKEIVNQNLWHRFFLGLNIEIALGYDTRIKNRTAFLWFEASNVSSSCRNLRIRKHPSVPLD